MKMLKGVKVIPLGGVEEIGFNSTVIEYENTQLLIDIGLGFPYGDLYGVDYIIPNISYLKKYRKLNGILITHGHLDHIGGLPFVLKELNFPTIYCTQFACELIKNGLERNGVDLRDVRFKLINKDSQLRFNNVNVSFFGVNHSIPESLGIIVKTPEGSVVHTGDFKFDNSPDFGEVSEYEKIAIAGKEGVLALLSDSTNSFVQGHSMSEKAIYENLFDIVKDAKGRVIVSTFSSLVSRIFQLIRIASVTNRKILVMGRSMQNVIDIALKLNYMTFEKNLFISPDKVNTLPPHMVMIIATGAQGETMAALSRIIRNESVDVKIKHGDTVILSASVIPGNDLLVQNLIDDLSEMGATVYHKGHEMDLHASGHGYQEDQKLMINLVKPKYFIPVHGYQSFLYKHAQTAMSVGIPDKNIIIMKRGEVLELNKTGFEKVGKVNASPVYVSGKNIGDVGNIILSERQQLANSGVLIVSALIDRKTNMLMEKPKILTRGFVFVKDNLELISSVADSAEKIIQEDLEQKRTETQSRDRLVNLIQKSLYRKTEKNPLILTLFTFV
jgi:ribonuclease J